VKSICCHDSQTKKETKNTTGKEELMDGDTYRRLQRYLNSMSIGFPATESGVEIELLKHFFTQEAAQMYMNLRELPEAPEQIAERINEDPKTVARFLDRMTQDGLLFRMAVEDKPMYAVAPFMVGICENKTLTATKEVLALITRYFDEAFIRRTGSILEKSAAMRIEPVGQFVDASQKVSTYSQNREYIKSKDKIAVMNCACRTLSNKTGKGCDKPLEACMAFDWYADYVVDIKLGRFVSKKEALDIQDGCEKAALVSLASNMSEGNIVLCHCCGCCCCQLQASKTLSRPAEMFVSNFHAAVDSDSCTTCGACLARCQMRAIYIENETARIDLDRCIGCGLCLTACPVSALELLQKSIVTERISPQELYVGLAQARAAREAQHD
jgi:Na+-translocating ferredoxin:NAD+ oxidoreductase subunit B